MNQHQKKIPMIKAEFTVIKVQDAFFNWESTSVLKVHRLVAIKLQPGYGCLII